MLGKSWDDLEFEEMTANTTHARTFELAGRDQPNPCVKLAHPPEGPARGIVTPQQFFTHLFEKARTMAEAVLRRVGEKKPLQRAVVTAPASFTPVGFIAFPDTIT